MYPSALSSLDPAKSKLLKSQLESWKSGSCHKRRQLAVNIESETALSVADFVSLLEEFCKELALASLNPEECWKAACKHHHFKGASFPLPVPARLGRAIPMSSYAKFVAETPQVGLSEGQCEARIRRVIMEGATPSKRVVRLLQLAKIGRDVIWATFNSEEPADCPFDRLPRTTEAVRTALGLGECSETETLVLISYRSSGPSGVLQLHRPTIAEAKTYPWYRPRPDPSAAYGMTTPLPPNPHGYAPQPEVVHRETIGETLVFPVYLAV